MSNVEVCVSNVGSLYVSNVGSLYVSNVESVCLVWKSMCV